jgi:hypothetical protein
MQLCIATHTPYTNVQRIHAEVFMYVHPEGSSFDKNAFQLGLPNLKSQSLRDQPGVSDKRHTHKMKIEN